MFNKYLRIFQSDWQLVHCMYEEMKILLFTAVIRFLKPKIVDSCKFTEDPQEIDVSDSKNHLPISKIEFGNEAKL